MSLSEAMDCAVDFSVLGSPLVCRSDGNARNGAGHATCCKCAATRGREEQLGWRRRLVRKGTWVRLHSRWRRAS